MEYTVILVAASYMFVVYSEPPASKLYVKTVKKLKILFEQLSRKPKNLWLFRGFPSTVTLTKTLNATCCIDKFLGAGEERMAFRADTDTEFRKN